MELDFISESSISHYQNATKISVKNHYVAENILSLNKHIIQLIKYLMNNRIGS